MHVRGRVAALGAAALVAACALTSCGRAPPLPRRRRPSATSSTTTTTTAAHDVDHVDRVDHDHDADQSQRVPNVIGLKIGCRTQRPARRGARRRSTLNTPCNKGTLASQSVVSSLAIPGKAPDPSVGAVPLSPGATVATGTPVGITWSGCFGDAAGRARRRRA